MTPRTGSLLVFASAVGWSTAGLFARAIPADVATVVLWRGLFGAAGLVMLILVLQGPPPPCRRSRPRWPACPSPAPQP